MARHVAGDYRVAMIGFTPGWSYLSGLDGSLQMPRRQNPRLLTPAGTISIGGVQTGVQCLAGPSGWHLLGRTAGPDLSAASRSDLPAGTRRSRDLFRRRCQNLRRAGSRRGSRRDRRRVDRRMSKLVISAIGPASSVQDGGRHGAQRYGLTPSGAMDRLALAAANTLVGNAPFARGDRNRPVRRRVHRARRRGPRRAGGRFAQRRHRRTRRRIRYLDDARGRRDPDARLCPRRLVQLSRDRGRHCRASRCSAASRSTRAPASAVPIRARCRPATNCRRRPPAARPSAGSIFPQLTDAPIRVVMGPQDDEFARRRQDTVSRQRVEDIGDQRPHGLPARRPRHQASARPQHRLRRHRQRQHPGARQRRSRSC